MSGAARWPWRPPGSPSGRPASPFDSRPGPLMPESRLRRMVLAFALWAGLVEAGHGQARAAYTLEQLDAVGRALATERCHRPAEIKTSFIRHPTRRDVADEMQSIDCRSFRIAVYRSMAQSPPRESPMSVVLQGGHPLASGPWAVGGSAREIRSVLGSPMRVFGESLVYSLSPQRPGQDTLTFEVDKGIVVAVSWSWDVE